MSEHNPHSPRDPKLIAAMGADEGVQSSARETFMRSAEYRYSYHWEWLGRPIIQYPEDMIAMQEVLWEVKPDLIIETGIAHGGSLIYYASILELIANCGGPADAEILGLDIDIRAHNREAIEAHPMCKRISMIEGSSIAADTIEQVKTRAAGKSRVLVTLDSNHTHEHVLAELEAYAELVTPGSYCVVFDTVVEDMPEDYFEDRPWGRGNNPRTAMQAFLEGRDDFEIDAGVGNKLLLTVAPDGFLKRIR